MTSSEMTPADIAACTGGSRGGSGFGCGDGLEWIVILFLFALFGNRGFGGGYGGGGSSAGDLYPWLNNSNQLNDGFQNQMLNDNITSIREGVYGINNQLCNGFAGVNASINGAQNAIAQQLYSNQIADMQQNFQMQSAFQNCCCENRAATADLKYTIATENCADRTQSLMNTRDIIEAQTRSTQSILDKLCQLELDGLKQDNANLRTQLNMATLNASQTAQTAQILQGQTNEVDALYNRLRSCPVPCQPVYGSQPIFTCNGSNYNSGCNCGSFA